MTLKANGKHTNYNINNQQLESIRKILYNQIQCDSFPRHLYIMSLESFIRISFITQRLELIHLVFINS